MSAVGYQREYEAEVARLIGQTATPCPSCGYQMGRLDEPRCPECGHCVTMREVGHYGTVEETRTALRLYGPIPCERCGVRIGDTEDACCPGCSTRVLLSWFPRLAWGPRRFAGPMRAAVRIGAFGMVSNVVPAAGLVAWADWSAWPGIALLLALCAWWCWMVWEVRMGRRAWSPWLVAAATWAWGPLSLLTLLR